MVVVSICAAAKDGNRRGSAITVLRSEWTNHRDIKRQYLNVRDLKAQRTGGRRVGLVWKNTAVPRDCAEVSIGEKEFCVRKYGVVCYYFSLSNSLAFSNPNSRPNVCIEFYVAEMG
jgi:hypothetical protein